MTSSARPQTCEGEEINHRRMIRLDPQPESPGSRDNEELVHADDRLVGRAFRCSAAALAVIAAAVVIGVILFHRKNAAAPVSVTPISAPIVPRRLADQIPVAIFTDITKDAGITFV